MTQSPPSQTRSPSPDAARLMELFRYHVHYTQGKHWEGATQRDLFVSLGYAVRDLVMDRKIATQTAYAVENARRVYYLSLEYLIGQSLRNNLVNLGLYEDIERELATVGVGLDALCDSEPDAGLGNGGLGRLGACFIDSLATLGYPAYAYGIRYEYGMFEQRIENGWQVEHPDYWLRFGTPWETERPEFTVPVRLYGRVVDASPDDASELHPARWADARTVLGVPYDMPVVGFGNNTVNLLRLWSARTAEGFDLDAFNRGGYVEAVRNQATSETISKVLYPNDNNEMGKELRLVQQYFFVACTIADILRRYDRTNDDLESLPDKVVMQLNDTHPSIAVAELMRVLVDERRLPWRRAWELTSATFNYTNHTLMPEALEVWPVGLLGRVLPRHLQLIYQINRVFLRDVVERRWPGDVNRVARLSLVQEHPQKAIRMAHLAIVGSRRVNGVARLHSDLVRSTLVPDFAELWPEKFINVTNGVTPRRWLRMCNPGLAAIISRRIGEDWIRDLSQLRRLEPLADDPQFQQEVGAVKRENKRRCADWLHSTHAIHPSPDAIFDVQVKRLHEYKRQLLNILAVIHRYQHIRLNPAERVAPRVVLFGAKAAPAYTRAKLIIKLINEVARVINADATLGDRLKVIFVPDYRVSVAERLIPAADLSEQISTAGTEASGTGNMKFAMNGALTIGTLDGANIEIREAVGADNFFDFGMTADQVVAARPGYDPRAVLAAHPALRAAVDSLRDGTFSRNDRGLFEPLVQSVLSPHDPYMVLADLPAYLEAQARVDALWHNPAEWARHSILNIARVGHFSSDRAIREYAERVWSLRPMTVAVAPGLIPSPALSQVLYFPGARR